MTSAHGNLQPAHTVLTSCLACRAVTPLAVGTGCNSVESVDCQRRHRTPAGNDSRLRPSLPTVPPSFLPTSPSSPSSRPSSPSPVVAVARHRRRPLSPASCPHASLATVVVDALCRRPRVLTPASPLGSRDFECFGRVEQSSSKI